MPVGSLAVVALALYRKYRPAKFAEVVGQEHVTEPLRTALAAGRINHAYLFSGPRGCGKTSSARILARSLNCEQGPTPDPCGVCSSCVSLAPGGPGNIDVTELDAASHGGVDDTRELRDRAFFAPAESRYRVFIVDEAHMITTQGFNALLKIVEEPPEHLVFVFATTEPDKVLTTIRSRTHHYPFRLIPPGTLRKLMERICAEEGAVVAQAVYPLVIRAGGGSARDSLSVLDQLLAGAGPEGVTYERAVALLGVTDVSLIDDMVDALAAGDRAAVFETVDRTVEAGHDPRRFAADLLQRLRDLTLLQAVPEAPARGLVDAADDEIVRMIEQADRLSAGTLARYGEIVHSGLIEMRGATAPRLLLELLCARMLLPAATVAEPGLLERLERLERRNAIAAAPLPAGETVAEPPAEQGSAASRRTFARPSNRPAAQEGGAQQSGARTGAGGRDGAAEARPDRDAADASPPRGGGMAAGDRADRESAPAGRPVDGPGGSEATPPAGRRAGDRPGGRGRSGRRSPRRGVAPEAPAGSSPADRTSAGDRRPMPTRAVPGRSATGAPGRPSRTRRGRDSGRGWRRSRLGSRGGGISDGGRDPAAVLERVGGRARAAADPRAAGDGSDWAEPAAGTESAGRDSARRPGLAAAGLTGGPRRGRDRVGGRGWAGSSAVDRHRGCVDDQRDDDAAAPAAAGGAGSAADATDDRRRDAPRRADAQPCRPQPSGRPAEPPTAPDPTGPMPAPDLDAAALRRVWPEILAAAKERKKRTAALLVSATVRAVEGDTLVLSIGTAPLARLLSEQSNTEVIAESLHAVLGVRWRVRCEHGEPGGRRRRRTGPQRRLRAAREPPARRAAPPARRRPGAPPRRTTGCRCRRSRPTRTPRPTTRRRCWPRRPAPTPRRPRSGTRRRRRSSC